LRCFVHRMHQLEFDRADVVERLGDVWDCRRHPGARQLRDWHLPSRQSCRSLLPHASRSRRSSRPQRCPCSHPFGSCCIKCACLSGPFCSPCWRTCARGVQQNLGCNLACSSPGFQAPYLGNCAGKSWRRMGGH
jgi:hypothetical protein